jgi:geranylgeranyl pyrophosphate synthase
VECFHKASLIHDDIEDADAERYGEATLHEQHGLAVALNVGDLLIGEGYRLLASSGCSAEQTSRMLQFAAQGQRQLCRGQGAELCWTRMPSTLTRSQVLDIFRHKTAPAFEVALHLGALCAGSVPHESVAPILAAYSEALGIAYQIRDDIDDFSAARGGNMRGLRPSLLLAIAHEGALTGADKQLAETLWDRRLPGNEIASELEDLFKRLEVQEHARLLLESYKEEAVQSLNTLKKPSLKGLLRRIIGKIFDETSQGAWCREVRGQNKE